MSRKRHRKPPPWMTAEEWAEWKAGEVERSRRLYERAKKLRAELEESQRAAAEAPPRRKRLFGLL